MDRGRPAAAPPLPGRGRARRPSASPVAPRARRAAAGGPPLPLRRPVLHQADQDRAGQRRRDRPRGHRELHRRRRLPALEKALTELTPADVIAGDHRGAACAAAAAPATRPASSGARSPRQQGAKKYVICNADEGDPGAFMDRSVLEGDPHRVLEGMAIAGYAVGAEQGYVYVRAEYPLAIQRLRGRHQAGRAAEPARHTASSTPASTSASTLRIGAGAFVCGEETALIASIEGSRGTPRPRPPYPAAVRPVGAADAHQQRRDLRQRPGHHPRTAAPGSPPSAPRSRRAPRSSRWPGKIKNTGLIEVPMGITLREIIYDIGGGIPDGQGRSRRPRPAAPRAAASRPSTSTCRWTTSRCSRSARSWARAASSSWTRASCMVDVATLLHGVLPRRVLRQVRPLPRRHGADARPPRADQPGRGGARRTWTSSRSWPSCSAPPACAAWARARPTRWSPPSATSATSTWPTCVERRCPAGVCSMAPRPARRPRPAVGRRRAMTVKTLQHRRQAGLRPRGRDHARRSAASTASSSRPSATSTASPSVGACRLCLVEVKGSPKLLPACTTAGRGGDGGHHRLGAAAALPAADRGAALRRAEPRLRRLRGQRPLRAAGGGATRSGWTTSASRTSTRPPSSTPATRASCSTTPAASSAPRCVRVCDEIEGAHTWDVADRGDARPGHHRPRRSPGARPTPAPAAASACRSAPPARSSRRSRSPPACRKNRDFLTYIKNAREKKQWIR